MIIGWYDSWFDSDLTTFPQHLPFAGASHPIQESVKQLHIFCQACSLVVWIGKKMKNTLYTVTSSQ